VYISSSQLLWDELAISADVNSLLQFLAEKTQILIDFTTIQNSTIFLSMMYHPKFILSVCIMFRLFSKGHCQQFNPLTEISL